MGIVMEEYPKLIKNTGTCSCGNKDTALEYAGDLVVWCSCGKIYKVVWDTGLRELIGSF